VEKRKTMISKVEIFNFQSHKETIVEFIPGTNVIIGPSDAGKSAMFRAINWVCSNRPLGDAFRSEWGGETKVVLHTSEGHSIERIRTNTKNEYILDGKKLEAFGYDVPEDVADILQIDFANIQAQMSPPFLLAATPGEAAQMLNKAASIDDIDHTLSGLKKSYGQIADRVKNTEKQVDEIDEQMQQYKIIPAIEKRLKRVERLELDREEKTSALVTLQQKVERASKIEEKLEETVRIPILLQECIRIEKIYNELQGKQAQHTTCKALTNTVRETQKSLNSTKYIDDGLAILRGAETALTNWKKGISQLTILKQATNRNRQIQMEIKELVYLKKTNPLLSETEGIFKNWQGAKKQLETLRQIMVQGQKILIAEKEMQKKIDRIKKEYKDLAPEECPLCGNKMDGKGGE
jgi:DNA repair protein SbcC/Rad50